MRFVDAKVTPPRQRTPFSDAAAILVPRFFPRQLAMFIARQLTRASLRDIGRQFDDRHYTHCAALRHTIVGGHLRETMCVTTGGRASACWNNRGYCSFAYSALAASKKGNITSTLPEELSDEQFVD